jgi:hypothetical protein
LLLRLLGFAPESWFKTTEKGPVLNSVKRGHDGRVGVWFCGFCHVWDFSLRLWPFGVRLGLILSDFVTDLQLSSVCVPVIRAPTSCHHQSVSSSFVPSFSFFHRVIITVSSAARSRPAPSQADCHRAREHEAET